MMSRLQQRCTPLLPLIIQTINKSASKSQLQRNIFTHKITLAIIERTPIICLSDFKHSIQSSFSKKQQFSTNPFNKFKTDYYTVIDKSWIALNAAVQYLSQPRQFPSPYEPYFHFKKDYREYCQQRPVRTYRCECELVTISSWSLKLVNIAQTGYYGVILHVLDSKRHSERFYQNLVNISSIIYEPQVQHQLESYRLADIRRNFRTAKDERAPYSLFYYCREIDSSSQLKRRQNNIIVMDKAKKILEYDQKQPQKYVVFGQIEGLKSLQFPLQSKEINNEKLKAIHSQNIEIFFNHLNMKAESKKTQKKAVLWSSSSQSQQEHNSEKPQKIVNQESHQENQDSQSSEQDPLRNLYINNFANLKK